MAKEYGNPRREDLARYRKAFEAFEIGKVITRGELDMVEYQVLKEGRVSGKDLRKIRTEVREELRVNN